jgi:hypothetical protein
MPVETIVFLSAVVTAFALLAVTIAWAQRRTVPKK